MNSEFEWEMKGKFMASHHGLGYTLFMGFRGSSLPTRRARVGILTVVTVCFGSFAWAEYNPENHMSMLSRLAPGILTISVRANRFIEKKHRIEDSRIFGKEMRRYQYRFFRKDIVPVAWIAGVDYSRLETASVGLTDPALLSHLIGARVGFNWEMSPYVQTRFIGLMNHTRQEYYGHGGVIWSLKVKIPFSEETRMVLDENPKHVTEMDRMKQSGWEEGDELSRPVGALEYPKQYDYDPNHARQFYTKKRTSKKKVSRRPLPEGFEEGDELTRETGFEYWARFNRIFPPYLELKLTMGYSNHLIEEHPFRLPSNTGTAVERRLNQYLLGVQFHYRTKKTSFRVTASAFTYRDSVNDFLTSLELDGFRRQAIVAGPGGWDQSGNQVLAYPSVALSESLEIDLNSRERFLIEFNQMTFAVGTQSPAYNISPNYFRKYGEDWELGFGALVGFGGVAPPLLSAFFSASLRLLK